MSQQNLTLLGAPDASIGSQEAKHHGLQVMQIDLTDEVLDELMDTARSGKLPQIFFGRAPSLRYGDQTQMLDTSAEILRHELYMSENAENLTFAGFIGHKLAVQVDDVFAGVDMAREALENNLRLLSQEKDARKTILVGDDSHPNHHRRNLSARSNFLKPSSHLNTPGRSNPSSPAFGASPRNAPTSAPSQLDAAKQRAIRRPVLHLLAVQPRSTNEVATLLRCRNEEAKVVLEKVAKAGSGDSPQFTLSDRSYKELDVFEFPYKTEIERQSAIDNAVRAYDRQRLAKEDKLWQKLLPKEERGNGKCLSRLNIKPLVAKADSSTKTTKKVEKKETTAKKAEVKEPKPKAVDEAAKKSIRVSEKPVAEPAKPLSALQEARRKKKEMKAAGVVAKEEPAKPSVQRPQKAAKVSRPIAKPARKYVSSPSASLLNKPKNPSPLSASPPVNASDFEDSHPVHKALSASTSPHKHLHSHSSTTSGTNSDAPLKRKANDLDNSIHTHSIAKVRKLDGGANQGRTPHSRTPVNGFKPGSHNSTPASNPATLKRKPVQVDLDSASSTSGPTPTKRPRLSDIPINNIHASRSSDSPNSNSPTSPMWSYQQTIQSSQKFQQYYTKYLKFYNELSVGTEPPTSDQRTKLQIMHDNLEKMKENIRTHAARHL